MEAYPGDPYAYMPTGGGRKFRSVEGVLPLILLIVIAFFVLQFLGVLPCVIPVGCGGEANVLIIGSPTPGVTQALSSKEARETGINSPVTFPQNYITTEMLQNYQVVILQGDPYFDMDTREAIKDYVDSGGNLIVVGDAGSHHPTQGIVAGWAWPSGQGIPVPAKLIDSELGMSKSSYGQELRMININHPIVKDLQIVGAQLNSMGEVFLVNSKGKDIAAIDTVEGESVPAIIEGGSGFGKVIYFAYDPGLTPAILWTSVKYLAGV